MIYCQPCGHKLGQPIDFKRQWPYWREAVCHLCGEFASVTDDFEYGLMEIQPND